MCYHFEVVDELLIIAGQSCDEHDRSDILKTMNPFSPFRLLASYVDQSKYIETVIITVVSDVTSSWKTRLYNFIR